MWILKGDLLIWMGMHIVSTSSYLKKLQGKDVFELGSVDSSLGSSPKHIFFFESRSLHSLML